MYNLSGIDQIIINDHYMIMIAVSLFFTVISIIGLWIKSSQISVIKTVSLAITFIAWIISGTVHLAASPASSPLFSLAWLWYAIGIVFLILLFVDSINTWKLVAERKWGTDY